MRETQKPTLRNNAKVSKKQAVVIVAAVLLVVSIAVFVGLPKYRDNGIYRNLNDSEKKCVDERRQILKTNPRALVETCLDSNGNIIPL